MTSNKSTEEMSLIQDIDTPAVIVDLKLVEKKQMHIKDIVMLLVLNYGLT